jgi:hypothetical protein
MLYRTFLIAHSDPKRVENEQRYTLRSSNVPEGPAQVEFCPSRNSLYIRATVYLFTRESCWNPDSSTGTWSAAWLPRLLCYRPAVFFRRFVSLRLHYPNEKFGARLKNVTIPMLALFVNRVSLKLRNLKLCKAGECLNAISLFQTKSSSHSRFLKSCQGRSLFVRLIAPWRRRIVPLRRPQTALAYRHLMDSIGKGKLYTSYVYDGRSGGV